MTFQMNDGGRAAAGYKGQTGDCVCRAIAIATGQSYQVVYEALNQTQAGMRQTRRVRGSQASTGMHRLVYERYLSALGWVFVPTMQIGSGCQVHLTADELPQGRLIARVSRHLCAVIDGVLHDISDCSRNGTRCVYGYYRQHGH